MTRRWLRVDEVAQALGCHPVTVRKLISRRAIPFVKKKGVGIRIDWRQLERELERGEVGPNHGRR